MNSAEAALRGIAADLRRHGVDWALVGGFAVSARTEPRFTRDVDVALATSDDRAAEEIAHTLIGEGYRLLASVEQDAVGRLATIRLASAAADVLVDLLFASSGVEVEIVRNAEVIEILPDLAVPVARIGDLIAVKLLARDDESRPQDLADLRALCGVATPADLDDARAAIHLIVERGFHRDRDLPAALATVLQQ